MEKLLEAEARLKGFSDEELASSFTRIVAVTKDATRGMQDLQLSEDLARARHIDLAAAALAVSKAEQGSTQALQRYGIVVPQVGTAVLALKKRHDEAVGAGAKFNQSMKEQYKAALAAAGETDKLSRVEEARSLILARFGGASATFAKTASGQFERLSQDVHQFEVAVAAKALPAVADAAEATGAFFTKLADSESVSKAVSSSLATVGDVFHVLAEGASAAAPTLLAITKGISDTVKEIGAPALLTGVAVYKSLGIAIGLAGAAQAVFVKVMAAGRGEIVGTAAAEGEAAATTTAYTAALVANTAALEANNVASAGAGLRSVDQLALGLGNLGRTAATTGEEVAAAGVKTAGAASGVGVFARGLAALGVAGTGGVIGGVTLGLAGLAAGAVYFGTRTSDAKRATNDFKAALDELGTTLNSTSGLLHDLSQSRVDLSLAKDAKAAADQAVVEAQANEVATRGTARHAAAILELKTARDQDRAAALSVGEAEKRTAKAQVEVATNAKDAIEQRNAEIRKALDSVDKNRSQSAAGARASFAGSDPGAASTQAAIARKEIELNAEAASKLAQRFAEDAAELQKKGNPGLATSVRLLSQYVALVGRLPSKAETKFILDPSNAKLSLRRIEADFTKTGALSVQGLNDAILAHAASITATVAGIFGALPGGVNGAATAAGEATGTAAADGIVAGLKAGQTKIRSELKTARDNLKNTTETLKGDITNLNVELAQSIKQQELDVKDAVTQAKSNLASIGSSLADSIGQILDKPLQVEQEKLTALANRKSLSDLIRSVLLPGGTQLSADPKKGLAELEALQKKGGPNSGAIQDFILQYRQAALAVKTDKANLVKEKTTQSLADLTDQVNRGLISPGAFKKKVLGILKKDVGSYKTAGHALGTAFQNGFTDAVGAAFEQAGAIASGPKQKGGANAITIVKPLDVLHKDQLSIEKITRELGQKHTALQTRTAKASEKIAGLLAKQAANQKAIDSAGRAPGKQGKKSTKLTGTTG